MGKNFTVKLDDEQTDFVEHAAAAQGVPCTEILREALNYYMSAGGAESLLAGPERGFAHGKALAVMLNVALMKDLVARMPETWQEAQRMLAAVGTGHDIMLSDYVDSIDGAA